MKQSNASSAMIDLDDLEKQVKALSSAKRSGGDDPLAELARIVGQDDGLGGLSGGARRAANPPDRIVPTFDDFLKSPPRPASGDLPAHTPPIEPLYPEKLASQQGQQIGASERSLLSEEFDRMFLAETSLRPALPAEPSVAETVDPQAAPAQALDGVTSTSQARSFEDMLAEFDAAMRDVGAQRSALEDAPPASLEPTVVPLFPNEVPPPPPWTANVAEAVAVGGAAIAATDDDAKSTYTQRGPMIAIGVVGIAMLGIVSLFFVGTGGKRGTNGEAPVIAAKPGVTKERPSNPGGVDVPNQDKEVLQTNAANPAAPEKVAPREEQPLDLTQAQKQAVAAPETAPAVRQIPGVAIVAPTSTTPHAGATQQPVPRPVASVPITIAGQPPALPAAVPDVTPPARSPAATLTPPAPVAAPTPAPQATVPAAASTPAPAPATTAEPRRVRAVPIRTDEGAPSRAQTQPRVVPANPRPAPVAAAPEPEETNAPLRITPQSNRTAPRVAAAAPAPAPTNPEPAAGGSGFTVQLSAEGSEDAARSKFNRVKSQHGGVLGSYNANIRSAEVNGRSVYRVRVGNFSREEAVGLCERLKADGGSCFVARN